MEIGTKSITDRYFLIWALFIPITSILLIPSVQGSLPSYGLAFLSFVLVLAMIKNKKRYFYDLFIISFIFFLVTLTSQLINTMVNLPSFENLTLVEEANPATTILRSSYFTQSLYFFVGILTFVFIKNFYKEEWVKYIFVSINIFAVYALYEFVYYLVFNSYGDFLSNRSFGTHDTIALGNQLMTISSVTFQRINGLTQEPSMFAFVVLPFWVYAWSLKKKKTFALLTTVLLLSTSSTAIIGIVLGLFSLIKRSNKLLLFFLLGFIALATLLFWNEVYMLLDRIILDKLQQSNESGRSRSMSFENHMEYYFSLNFLSALFGIGFGYVRSSDLFSTFLVNTGLVGFVLFTILYLIPILKLKKSRENLGIKLALIIIYVTMMVSVPEYSYLSSWLFLGIAYYKLSQQKLAFCF
ncbi:hypothetical protein [Metabacillus sp. FJAT-53654]|uniref:O-antigen ligase domain-containing protein n=1 Tax=Metabacillus rhizosphaerae TaxID=3117747 RepID=A0ABZ2MYB5_9BACI